LYRLSSLSNPLMKQGAPATALTIATERLARERRKTDAEWLFAAEPNAQVIIIEDC
jgi:hypothetical protein